MYQQLINRINEGCGYIGVIGLGYGGLPLAAAWAREGFLVTGIDIDLQRVAMCQQGTSWIADVSSDDLKTLVRNSRLSATTDMEVLSELDAISICVPTPLNKTKDPDISAVLNAVEMIAAHLHHGQLIVLESTTYPGTTDELVLPRLCQTGLTVGEDFFLAFSPERTNPGNNRYGLCNTPKGVSGTKQTFLDISSALSNTLVDTIVPVGY